METVNHVTELNDYALKTGSKLHYEDHGSVGPHHNATFTQRAVLNGKVYPDGVGKNKKEAKHNAAKNALKCLLKNEHQDSVDSKMQQKLLLQQLIRQVSATSTIYGIYEYGQKNRVTVRAVESKNATPCCSFVVGDKEYPAVTGETKREAKENAIYGSKTTETADEKYNYKSRQQETNYIGIVNHYCQKTKRCHSYIEERRCGPPHNPQFFYKLIIDKNDYPVAEGKTVKEAKQNAARFAWSALQEQSDWDSKVSVRSIVSEDGAPPVSSAQSATLESSESRSTSMSTSDSIIFTNLSNPSMAQMPFRSTAFEDDTPTRLSTQTIVESYDESSSQSMPMSTSDSLIFTNSSNPSETQMPLRSTASADDAPTRLSTPTSLESLASSQSSSTCASSLGLFTDSSNSSKDQDVAKDKKMGNSQNETWNQSRFTLDFDPLERLGSGGFGCVYKARRKKVKNCYAVKIVCCEEKSFREVETLSDLHHRNIVRFYAFWVEDSGYQWDISSDSYRSSQSTDNSSAKYLYIQMELCDTKTLRGWIDEKNAQSLQDSKRREESLSIAYQIVSGVEYIHSKKHVHRDLKPDNILFALHGEVKIGDFGLVTRDDDDDYSALMERTGYRGTKTYMAPEQKRETYDRKVDIFPLGLIYFELLWKLSTSHERAEVWDNARSQKLPEKFSLTFPQENQIIESMLCEKPEDRPEASNLKADLEKWAQTFNTQNMRQENVTV